MHAPIVWLYYLVGSVSNQSCLHAISERSQEVSVYDSFCAADFGDAVVISLRQGVFSRLIQSWYVMLRDDAEWFNQVADKQATPPQHLAMLHVLLLLLFYSSLIIQKPLVHFESPCQMWISRSYIHKVCTVCTHQVKQRESQSVSSILNWRSGWYDLSATWCYSTWSYSHDGWRGCTASVPGDWHTNLPPWKDFDTRQPPDGFAHGYLSWSDYPRT